MPRINLKLTNYKEVSSAIVTAMTLFYSVKLLSQINVIFYWCRGTNWHFCSYVIVSWSKYHFKIYNFRTICCVLFWPIWACSQCSAPKHLTFNPTFPRKQKLFSREGKDLVILPLLQEICKDKMKGLLC